METHSRAKVKHFLPLRVVNDGARNVRRTTRARARGVAPVRNTRAASTSRRKCAFNTTRSGKDV
jgi:hypothetical protein